MSKQTLKQPIEENQLETIENIQFEEVTVKIPKKIMALLRANQKACGETPKEYIEYHIVDVVRANIDAEAFFSTPKQMTDAWELDSIFKIITNFTVIPDP